MGAIGSEGDMSILQSPRQDMSIPSTSFLGQSTNISQSRTGCSRGRKQSPSFLLSLPPSSCAWVELDGCGFSAPYFPPPSVSAAYLPTLHAPCTPPFLQIDCQLGIKVSLSRICMRILSVSVECRCEWFLYSATCRLYCWCWCWCCGRPVLLAGVHQPDPKISSRIFSAAPPFPLHLRVSFLLDRCHFLHFLFFN